MSALEDLELYGILLDKEWQLLAQVTTDLGTEASAVRMKVRRWLAGREKSATEAAMPAIREHIAQEIEEVADDVLDGDGTLLYESGKRWAFFDAARIARGGTP